MIARIGIVVGLVLSLGVVGATIVRKEIRYAANAVVLLPLEPGEGMFRLGDRELRHPVVGIGGDRVLVVVDDRGVVVETRAWDGGVLAAGERLVYVDAHGLYGGIDTCVGSALPEAAFAVVQLDPAGTPVLLGFADADGVRLGGVGCE